MCSASIGSGQLPALDIGMFDMGNNTLEVRLRPDGDFNEVFSALVFTVRWDAGTGATLGAETQPPDVLACHGIAKSGPEYDENGFRYQAFAGFGFITFQDQSLEWFNGSEYVVCTIPVLNGSGAFEIANDGWTNTNNGDYFISLNGSEQTGLVYSGTTLLQETMGAGGLWVSLQPNPAVDNAQLELSASDGSDAHVRLLDPTGRDVWSANYRALQGVRRETIDLKALDAGTYLLSVENASGRQVRRLVVQ